MRNQNKLFTIFICLLLLFTFTFSKEDKPPTFQEQLMNGMFSIKSATLYEYVKELCKKEYAGRLTGDIGFDKAAKWLIEEFKKMGVKSLPKDGSYLQKFPHPYTLVLKDCQVQMLDKEKGKILKKFKYFNEFIPGSTSGSGEITAEAVYVGFGITARELNYDDYTDVDVKGKIVVMERESPVSPGNKDKKLFKRWRKYSFHQYKLQNAYKHGARGMLYNYGPIGNPNNDYIKDFIYTHIGKVVMKDLFAPSGKNPEEVKKKIQKTLKPHSFYTKIIMYLKNSTEHHPEGIGSNVIGYIEGSDPKLKEEFIIIGGHLDHLGLCYEMMPGANDNASAIAVMLEIAQAFKESKIKPKRSIMFLAFGAEEAAIRGTQFYLNNPLVAKKKTLCLINMDGVGIGKNIFAGFGKNYPKLFSYFEMANKQYVHRKLEPGYSDNLGRPRLDAAFFDWAKIPVLSFSTWGGGPDFPIYHTPADNIDYITPEIMEDLGQALFIGIVNLANDNQDLEFERR